MALVVSETLTADILEALDDAGRVVVWRQRRHFGLYGRQIDGSATATVRDGAGGLICILGLWQDVDDPLAAEGWFAVGAAFRHHRVAAFRIMREMLDAAFAGPLRGYVLRAHVDPGNVAGARLAGWLGFTDDGLVETGLGSRRRYLRRVL